MKDVKGKQLASGDYVEITGPWTMNPDGNRPIAIVQRPRVNLSYGVRVELIRVDHPGLCYYPGTALIKKEPEELI